jgi:SAM-dependent methyltransferase
VDASTFAVEDRVEETHWWFRGRRRLLRSIFSRLALRPGARALDAGTGTGANLRLLRELDLDEVRGIDASRDAIQYCEGKGLGPVIEADLCALPFPDGSFDVVLATDIVEHIDDDRRALTEIARALAPGGYAVLTVPAFPSLWGLQDVVAHHKRRYRIRAFRRLIEESGLEIERSWYFNYILFVPIFLARQILRVLKPKIASENEVNTPWINRILSGVFALDVTTAPWLHPPFGVSIAVVARRPVLKPHETREAPTR